MRTSRIKYDSQSSWYHCYNRTAGTSFDRPLDDADKEQFVRILHRVAELYTVRVIAYQIMSNHFHLLLQAPQEEPAVEEICRRFKAFHGGARALEPDSSACRQWQARSRDISWFMRHLQHLFTAWYNRTRPIRRRGSLWADRYKHTILESGRAVWACWTYLENNPVRAGMVKNAANYRFCSHGWWHQSGRHPFAEHLSEVMLPMLTNLLGAQNTDDLKKFMDAALAEKNNGQPEPFGFTLHVHRRVRHWADGLIIGSELFVRTVMSRYRQPGEIKRHRTAPCVSAGGMGLCAWRRVRVPC